MSVFDDLVGQEVVVAQLQAAADAAARSLAGEPEGAGGMTHAWLFTGPPARAGRSPHAPSPRRCSASGAPAAATARRAPSR